MTSATKPFDVDAVRKQFPILAQGHHPGVPLTYLDNAATSQKPLAVIEALNSYYQNYNANVHRGIHKLSEEATQAYEESRLKVRKFINAGSKREIIFTRGTTEGINLVVQTWGRANLGPGDVVISSVMEHHSNIVPWQILAAEKGFILKFLPITNDGHLDLNVLEEWLRTLPVKMVSLMHVSNVLGTVNPIRTIAELAHKQGALLLVDGAQSIPHMSIDVQALDADFFVFSGHKMLGPTGIGVLYGKRNLLEAMPPWMGGGDMISSVRLEGSTWNDLPYKFEAGTPAIAEVIGLGAAVDYLTEIGMDAIHAYEASLTHYLLERLSEVADLTVYGPDAAHKGAVAAFTYADIHPHDIAQLLDSQGIAIRAGHHCAMPLHHALNLNATARASVYFYNTAEEIDHLVEGLYYTRKTFAI
jgi:cysteine desulfurase / selenocysteine lyase